MSKILAWLLGYLLLNFIFAIQLLFKMLYARLTYLFWNLQILINILICFWIDILICDWEFRLTFCGMFTFLIMITIQQVRVNDTTIFVKSGMFILFSIHNIKYVICLITHKVDKSKYVICLIIHIIFLFLVQKVIQYQYYLLTTAK